MTVTVLNLPGVSSPVFCRGGMLSRTLSLSL